MTNPEPPLSPDTVDELLCAELDGELDAAATDLGLTPETARAALAATPGANDRRRALRAARDALGHVEEIDVGAVDSLVARALATDPGPLDELSLRRRRGAPAKRALTAAGSIAAAILVVLLVVAALHGSSSSGVKASHATAAPDTPARERQPADAGSTALGSPKSASALRDRVRRELAGEGLDLVTFGQANAPASRPVETGNPPSEPTTLAPSSARTAAGRCAADALQRYDLAAPPVLTATATFRGREVTVFVFPDHDEFAAYVLSSGDCSTVATLTVP